MMIEAFKWQDGEALGANKVGERSGENEAKIRDILEPPKPHNKNAFVPKPNHLRNRRDTTESCSRVTWGTSSLVRRERN
jgi:hypothetical protein